MELARFLELFLLEWLITVTISLAQVSPTSEESDEIISGEMELKITSVMLENTLNWRPPVNNNESDFKYTVLYRMESPLTFPWETATECVFLNDTKCDLNAGNNLRQSNNVYYLKVIATEGKTEIRYCSRILKFQPAIDTILLPPSFDAKCHENFLFITPDKQEAISLIESLSYQIQYWKEDFENTKSNRTVHSTTSKEIVIKVDTDSTYCIRIRLSNEHIHDDDGNGRSIWSDVQCLKSGQHVAAAAASRNDQKHNNMIIFIIIGFAALLTMVGGVYLSFRLWKTYKFVNKKEPLPEVLITIFHEAPDDNKYNDQKASHMETVDEVFASTLDYSEVLKIQQDEQAIRKYSCSTESPGNSPDPWLSCGSCLINANAEGCKFQNFYSGEEAVHYNHYSKFQIQRENVSAQTDEEFPSTSCRRPALTSREAFPYEDFRQVYKDKAIEIVTDFDELATDLSDNHCEGCGEGSNKACVNLTLMNITYSSDPARAAPDILFRDYGNNPMLDC